MSTEVINQEDTIVRQCPMFKVIMHNDDVTSQRFVVGILHTVFGKKIPDAVITMLEVHNSGSALAGVYALEHAELKVEQTHSLARAQKFPLTCTIEPA